MACKYWRVVLQDKIFDEYEYGEISLFECECLNCKNRWTATEAPFKWKVCPFCEVRWVGKFPKVNKKYWVENKKNLPYFQVQHLEGRPYDCFTDRWVNSHQYNLFDTKAVYKEVFKYIKDMMRKDRYNSPKAIRVAVVKGDGTKTFLPRIFKK